MTDKDQAEPTEETEGTDQPLNREQRRAQRFGRRIQDVPQDNLQPQSANNPTFGRSDAQTNPAFGEGAALHDSTTTSTHQGPTNLTGAGTGGATETGDRLPHHEAMPSPQNQPNS